MEPDRPQGEGYHQKIGGDRAEGGGPRAGEEGPGGAIGQGLATASSTRPRTNPAMSTPR